MYHVLILPDITWYISIYYRILPVHFWYCTCDHLWRCAMLCLVLLWAGPPVRQLNDKQLEGRGAHPLLSAYWLCRVCMWRCKRERTCLGNTRGVLAWSFWTGGEVQSSIRSLPLIRLGKSWRVSSSWIWHGARRPQDACWCMTMIIDNAWWCINYDARVMELSHILTKCSWNSQILLRSSLWNYAGSAGQVAAWTALLANHERKVRTRTRDAGNSSRHQIKPCIVTALSLSQYTYT